MTFHVCFRIGINQTAQLPFFSFKLINQPFLFSGCTSVQRIIAELIPRYAIFCPSALESVAKVVVSMHNWSIRVIKNGEDLDDIPYQTAKACIFGFVDICSTASSEVSTSSAIKEICSSVFAIAFDFFISALEGEGICMIGRKEIEELQKPLDLFHELKQEEEDSDKPMLLRLSRFLALCFVKLLLSCPRDLLGACFDLISSSTNDEEKRNKGFYFLNHMTTKLNEIQEKQATNMHHENKDLPADVMQMSIDHEVSNAHGQLSPQNTCLLEMVSSCIYVSGCQMGLLFTFFTVVCTLFFIGYLRV